MEEMNLEQDLSINKYQLDLESISLPGIYFRYKDACEEAKQIVASKSDMVKVILAERNIAIRENCANSGKKVTEKLIESMVECDSEVVNARKELREAEAMYSRLSVAVSSLDVKKSSIDNLVKLYCNSYYANKDNNPDRDFKSDMISTELRKNMTPLPK